MISDRISDDILHQMSILNMVIPILRHFCSLECCKLHKATHHPTKCDAINDVKLFPTVYCKIYCHKFLMLSIETLFYKLKCIRVHDIF